MADIGLSAFSVFFMGSPSFLAHQTGALEEGQGRSNCQTLFGMTAIPSDALYPPDARRRLARAAFDPLFFQGDRDRRRARRRSRRLGGRTLIALDGTEHFCSRKIHCKRCSTRRRSDGGTEYFHAFLGASIVAPGHTRWSCRCPPSSSRPRTARRSRIVNATPRNAGWPGNGAAVARLRPIYLGDDLFSCQPIAEANPSGGRQLHPDLQAVVAPDRLRIPAWRLRWEEHRQTEIVSRGKRRTTTITAGSPEVPLRATRRRAGRHLGFHRNPERQGQTDLLQQFRHRSGRSTPATSPNFAACGRARWKIENETFNVLKTNGYNLEHNFGHGKETLASVLVVLNLLAFGFHTAAMLGVLGMAPGRHRPRRQLPVLRTPPNDHSLCRVPGLGSSASIHHRRRHTPALTARFPRPAQNPPRQGDKTSKIPAKPEFRIAAAVATRVQIPPKRQVRSWIDIPGTLL